MRRGVPAQLRVENAGAADVSYPVDDPLSTVCLPAETSLPDSPRARRLATLANLARVGRLGVGLATGSSMSVSGSAGSSRIAASLTDTTRSLPSATDAMQMIARPSPVK